MRPGLLALFLFACGEDLRTEDPPDELDIDTTQRGLIDCAESEDTGYVDGNAFAITLVTVDGKPAQIETANAYHVMQQAASQDGVDIAIVSGFRTMAQQEYLYDCYVNCNCNNCNLAARPGYSNHQSGHALDLNTSRGGVLGWLNANGAAFGFERTVPSEDWHWEWWGGGPGGGPCGRCEPSCDGDVIIGEDCGRGDCSAFAAYCSTSLGAPRCVSAFCVGSRDETPAAHDVCLENGRYHCDDVGGIAEAPCAKGEVCLADLDARCVGLEASLPEAPVLEVTIPALPVEPVAGDENVAAEGVVRTNETPVHGGCGCDAGQDRDGALSLLLIFGCVTLLRARGTLPSRCVEGQPPRSSSPR